MSQSHRIHTEGDDSIARAPDPNKISAPGEPRNLGRSERFTSELVGAAVFR